MPQELKSPDYWENRAKHFENEFDAANKEIIYLQKQLEAYRSLPGREGGERWIGVNELPADYLNVLVTNGESVWIGDYCSKRSERDGKWSLVYNGALPFDSTEITHWQKLPLPEISKSVK